MILMLRIMILAAALNIIPSVKSQGPRSWSRIQRRIQSSLKPRPKVKLGTLNKNDLYFRLQGHLRGQIRVK